MSQEAEVRLKLVIDSSGARVIDSITGATVKVVDAEKDHAEKIAHSRAEMEKLRKEVEALNKAYGAGSLGHGGNGGLPGGSSILGTGGWPKMSSELKKNWWPTMVPPPTSTAAQLHAMTVSGSRDPAERQYLAKEKQVQDGWMLAAGMASGFAAAAMMAMKEASHLAQVYNDASANPYKSFTNKREEVLTQIPLAGWMRTFQANMQDFMSGRGEQLGQVTLNTAYQDYRAQTLLAMRKLQMQSPDGEGQHQAAGWRDPVYLEDPRRDTVGSARRYQEQQQMMGVREQAEEAKMRQNAASVEAQKYSDRKRDLLKTVSDIDRGIGGLKNQLRDSESADEMRGKPRRYASYLGTLVPSANFVSQGDIRESPRTISLRADLAREYAKKAELIRQSTALTEMEKEQHLAELKAASDYKSATQGPEYLKAKLGMLQGREAEAQGQARALGMAGPMARFQALNSLESLKQMGIENASPEMIGQASALFPKTVGQMAEKSGKGMFKEFHEASKDEYAYQLDDARKDVNQTQRELAEAVPKLALETAKANAEALKEFLEEFVRLLKVQNYAEFRKIEMDKVIANNK